MPCVVVPGQSDTDFRVTGVGMDAAIDAAIAAGVPVVRRAAFPSLMKPSSAPLVFPELNEVSDKWAPRVHSLGRHCHSTQSFYAVVGCHCSRIYTAILPPLLSFLPQWGLR